MNYFLVIVNFLFNQQKLLFDFINLVYIVYIYYLSGLKIINYICFNNVFSCEF